MVTAPGSVGQPLMALALSPHLLVGTRFAAEAALWSRWRPTSLHLRVTSAAGTTTGGSYMVGWTPNPAESLPVGVGGVRKISTYEPHSQQPLHGSCSLRIPVETTTKWYIAGARDLEFAAHGAIHALLASPVTGVTAKSGIALAVHLDWTIQVDGPELPVQGTDEYVQAEPDYCPYFTTSVSDWNEGKTLTLKAHSGGAVVPFPGIQHQTVYELDAHASVEAYDGDNKVAVKYIVAIPGYAGGLGVAAFANVEKATQFAKTGDVQYCMAFTKAGAYCTPPNPLWKLVGSFQSYLTNLSGRLEMIQISTGRLEPSTGESPFQAARGT